MSTRSVTNLILAGVGGQGSVLATKVLALAAQRAGQRVVTSEVHGMSQRGGTVVTTVRYGARVYAPAIPAGEADFLVASERLEGVRHLPLLRPGGVALVNDQRITPSIEALKLADYPTDLDALAAAQRVTLHLVPALALASELGEPKLASSVLLGALSRLLDLPAEAWRGALAESVPPRTVEANLAAFARGAEWALAGAPG